MTAAKKMKRKRSFVYPRSTKELSTEKLWIQRCPCIQGQIGIWKCWFLFGGGGGRGGGKRKKKNPRRRDKNQQQTQLTYGVNAGSWTRAKLVGGQCSHHYAIPAPCPSS